MVTSLILSEKMENENIRVIIVIDNYFRNWSDFMRPLADTLRPKKIEDVFWSKAFNW